MLNANTLKFLVIAFFGLIAVSAEAQQPSKTVVDQLDVKSFKTKMDQDKNHVLLDVRTPAETNEGIIPGAELLNFNSPDFSERINAMDKEKHYYVYCKVGGRSGRTVELMKNSGFKNVHDLKGGYDQWVREGYTTVKPKP